MVVAKAKVKVANVPELKKPCGHYSFSMGEAPSVKGGKFVKKEVKEENLGGKSAKEEVKEENSDGGAGDDVQSGSRDVAEIGEIDVKAEVKHEFGIDDEAASRDVGKGSLERWCRGPGEGQESGQGWECAVLALWVDGNMSQILNVVLHAGL